MNITFTCKLTELNRYGQIETMKFLTEDNKIFHAEIINNTKFEIFDILPMKTDFDNNILSLEKQGYKINPQSTEIVNKIVQHDYVKIEDNLTKVKGNTKWVVNELLKWFEQYDTINLITYDTLYSGIFLTDILWGSLIKIPTNIKFIYKGE